MDSNHDYSVQSGVACQLAEGKTKRKNSYINGWGRWIRTTVDGTKDRRPTARRFPNKLVDLYGLEPQLAGSEPELDERSI